MGEAVMRGGKLKRSSLENDCQDEVEVVRRRLGAKVRGGGGGGMPGTLLLLVAEVEASMVVTVGVGDCCDMVWILL